MIPYPPPLLHGEGNEYSLSKNTYIHKIRIHINTDIHDYTCACQDTIN